MVRFVAFLTMPLTGGIFMLAPQFTQIFLGEKWMPMVPALRILAISVMIKTIIATGSALYDAVGRPKLSFITILSTLIVLATIIYPLTMLWGLSGTACAVLIAYCITGPIRFFYNFKVAGVRARDYRGVFLPPLIGTAIMVAVIFVLGILLNQFRLIGFLVSAVTGVVTFFSFIFLIQNISDYTVLKDVKFIFNSLSLRRKTRL